MSFTKETIVGKRILIRVSLLDEQGKIDSRVQVHGKVVEFTNQYIKVLTSTGEEFFIPPSFDKIKPSPPEAVYTIQETNEELTDIEAVAVLTMTPA
ncbi:MAG: hypothetical protein U1D96_08485 [Eubacteriales bacterium]|nr:hypothetical protein [Bacillota bacterium]MBV1727623.1 hypothetical protein [Desulforudis sp.]MDP3050186.1 hypothetical protein [Eubacteriales bacterium]MDQ7789764.1 hypothetical protein [Clostridia bacterium]MBU4532685.1 hypothetical protein [Bacillota bacterium]